MEVGIRHCVVLLTIAVSVAVAFSIHDDRVPSVCQLAHKLAEHAGNFSDSGASIKHEAFTNKMYFL